jgi:hypothetical protein
LLCQNCQGSHFGKQKEKSDATHAHLKIYKKTLVQYLRVVLHPNIYSWVLIHEWGGASEVFCFFLAISNFD